MQDASGFTLLQGGLKSSRTEFLSGLTPLAFGEPRPPGRQQETRGRRGRPDPVQVQTPAHCPFYVAVTDLLLFSSPEDG